MGGGERDDFLAVIFYITKEKQNKLLRDVERTV